MRVNPTGLQHSCVSNKIIFDFLRFCFCDHDLLFARCRNADEIIVLDAGVVLERGTHDQLVELGGRYQSMLQEQNPAVGATLSETHASEPDSTVANPALKSTSIGNEVQDAEKTPSTSEVPQHLHVEEGHAMTNDITKRYLDSFLEGSCGFCLGSPTHMGYWPWMLL